MNYDIMRKRAETVAHIDLVRKALPYHWSKGIEPSQQEKDGREVLLTIRRASHAMSLSGEDGVVGAGLRAQMWLSEGKDWRGGSICANQRQ
jgi:hypothetical protein